MLEKPKAAHGFGARDLFTRLLLVQAVVGRDPEPLRMRDVSGELLLTLTSRIGSLH